MNPLEHKRVTVAGLGHFGGQIAAARWLVEQGARVLVTDRASAEDLADSVRQLDGLPIEFHLGGHQIDDFTQTDLIVASPAIPPSNEWLVAARNAGVPITTEICLFLERCPAMVIGVTGTKGKSTTTSLLGRMLDTRFTTHVGGNIGKSLLSKLGQIKTADKVVVELSSYMLHYLGEMSWSPHMSVVTMLAADHVEWHGGLEGYLDAKANIVRFQKPADFAILNEEDPPSVKLTSMTAARCVMFGLRHRRPLELDLPGRHNQLNAQAALTAAGVLGVPWEAAQDAVRDWPGLPHRMEWVHAHAGVRYCNDSIATIPEAAIAALESFPPKRVIQIVGGYDHHLPVIAMCNALVDRAKAVLCIGQTGDQLADLLSATPHPTAAAIYRCGDLPTAMKMAKQIAVTGDIVLLSTGYKSYGQFRDFEQRGDAFTRLARETSL